MDPGKRWRWREEGEEAVERVSRNKDRGTRLLIKVVLDGSITCKMDLNNYTVLLNRDRESAHISTLPPSPWPLPNNNNEIIGIIWWIGINSIFFSLLRFADSDSGPPVIDGVAPIFRLVVNYPPWPTESLTACRCDKASHTDTASANRCILK